MFYKALHSADIYRCRYATVLDELGMDLGGVKPGEGLLEAEDLFHGRVGKRAGTAFVRTLVRQKGIEAETLIKGHPLFDCLVADFPDGAVRDIF